MKRGFIKSAVIVAVILLMMSLLTLCISAEEQEISASGYFGELNWSFSKSNGTLVISGEGRMVAPSAYDYWYTYASFVKYVEIGEGAQNIAGGILSECKMIESIIIPNSVTEIDEDAFYINEYFTLKCNYGSYAASYAENNGITAEYLDIIIMGECGKNVYYRLDDKGTLTISGKGRMKDYYYSKYTQYITIPWYSRRSLIKEVIVEDGVTHIGDSVFRNCYNLKAISISSTVKSIGEYTFTECTLLKEVNLSDLSAWCSLESVGSNPLSGDVDILLNGKKITELVIPGDIEVIRKYAFAGCSSITSVIIGDNVKSVGDYAFSGCNGLTSVTMGDSVTSIGSNAFSGCNGLTSVTMGDSVTSIGSNAFYECENLSSVTFSSSVLSVGKYAFAWCPNLHDVFLNDSLTVIEDSAFYYSGIISIDIPATVTEIGQTAFCECFSLTEINVDPNNQVYSSVDGVLINKLTSTLVTYPGGKTQTEYTIPDNIKELGYASFILNKYLETVNLSESVTKINGYAFYKSSLKSINFCENLKIIDYDAFSYCENLINVNLPDSLIELGYGALAGSAIESISIPGSVEYISGDAFFICRNLKNVEIGYGVKIIGSCAFAGCSSLESIDIPDSVTELYSAAFEDCSSLKNVDVSDNIVRFGSYVFEGTPFLDNMLDSETVSIYIENYFIGIYEWKHSYSEFGKLSRNTKCIADYAFSGESSIRDLYIPPSVRGIGYGAFYNCKFLNSVNIPDGIETLYGALFYNCSALKTLSIPDSVTAIHSNVFTNCTSLTRVTIPASVTSIADNAFNNTPKLTIYCYKGSYAETYAIEHSIPYAYICDIHSFTNYVSNNDGNCTTNCTATAYCDYGCGVYDTVVIEGLKVHYFISYVYNNDATCTKDGTKTGYCYYGCGTTDTVVSKGTAKGHSCSEYTYNNDATCTKDGTKYGVCTRCKSVCVYTVPDSKVDHKYARYTYNNDATCTNNGTETAYCEYGCGNSNTRILNYSKLPHTMGEWKVIIPATSSTEGKMERICVDCSYSETEVIPTLLDPELSIDGYNILITKTDNIKYIRYALGEYSIAGEIKAAQGCVTLNATAISKLSENNIAAIPMTEGGVYSFWIKYHNGEEFIYTLDLADMEQETVTKGLTLTVKNLYGVKDYFIAKGEYDNYTELRSNALVQITKNKIGSKHDYSYILPEAGIYTVCVRYNDSTRDYKFITVIMTVTEPEFTENGLQLTVSNLEDVKVIRTAYGEYSTAGEVKRAPDAKAFTAKGVLNSLNEYTVKYSDEGTVTVAVV
ncbi:MAG: leucine-rich repeat protein, partial [Clostridia bacterium]|nr:leucine-rich repeat protein [Clostridia bacterium]